MSARAVVGGISAAVLALAGALIVKWEGVRYEPYKDSVGVYTVCYGHTGPDVKPGRTYTKEGCQDLLTQDMAEANADVKRCIPVPLLPQIEAALTSAAFNVGSRVVCGSMLQEKALANNWPGACAELDRWKFAGGRVLRGLELRRADERQLCETGKY